MRRAFKHEKRRQNPWNWTKNVARHMVSEGPRFAIPSILYSPLTAASVFTPISLARSSALIEVYALETRSKALFWSFSGCTWNRRKTMSNRLNGASSIECNLRMGEQGHLLGSCKWPNSPRVSHSSVVRACSRYLEGHGFDSCLSTLL